VLPRAPSTTSEAAERGTAIHAYLEEWAKTGERPTPPAGYEETCEGLSLPFILNGRTVWIVEAAFALDAMTGKVRYLGAGKGRDYGALCPTEIAGTADLVLLDDEGRLYVADYKTGSAVTSAKTNPQLAFLALCLSKFRGNEEVGVELIYIREDGSHYTDAATLDALDLDGFASDLRDAVTLWRSPEAAQRVNPGEWCGYCPSKWSCPVWTSLAREMGAGTLVPARESLPVLTPELAWATKQKIKRAREVLKETEKGLDAYLDDITRPGAVTLETGERIGRIERTREDIDPDVAVAVLERLYGPELARACYEGKVTKEGIRRALKGQRGASAQVLREIAAEGGITKARWVKVAELGEQREEACE
jgi:hypothetical protein